MITDRIRQQEVLLPINQNYDKIWKRNYTKTINSAKCKTTACAHTYHVLSTHTGMMS